MRLLLRYLRQRPKLVAFALFCAFWNQIFVLLDPLIFRYIIDGFTFHAARYSTTQFMLWAALLLGAAMAAALIAWVAKSFQLDAVNRITRGVGVQLYSDAVQHSLGLPYADFEAQQSGEIMATIQPGRHSAETFLTLLLNTGFSSTVAAVFVIVYAARLNWMLAPPLLIGAPMLVFASSWLGRRVRDIQRSITVETAQLYGSTGESLRNIEIVRSLGLGKEEVSRLNARNDRILRMELEKTRQARRLTFFHGACVNLLRSALVLFFLYQLFTKQITMGQFFSMMFYSYLIFTPMQELGNVTVLYQETEAPLRTIEAILRSPQQEPPSRPTPVGPLETVEFRNVTFHYPTGSDAAVSGISFEAVRGETIAFVGPSGSGKSTLVKLLTGLYSKYSGEIAYNGIPGSQVDLDELGRRIGLVTQDARLFSGTIRDNLIFAKPDATDEECFTAFRQAAAGSLLARAGQGLNTVIGEGGVRLSGGEKQRISIARALLRAPDLLIFDEATSALDSLTEEEIVRTIRSVHRHRQTITVIIAHRPSTVRHAHRIYVLNRGAITETGTHEKLLEAHGLYYDLWQQQTGDSIAQAAI
jgi:ATP-binding cassette subfamily B protein